MQFGVEWANLIWLDLAMPQLKGGGRGEHEAEQLGRAIQHVRKLQIKALSPQHLRLLLQAHPRTADEVLREEDAARAAKVLQRQAKKAQLPWTEANPEVPPKDSQQPQVQMMSKGQVSSSGKGGGQQKEGKSPTRQATKAKAEGKGHGLTDSEIPVLFDKDWPVPVVKELFPGQQGVQIAKNMSDAGKIVERMKHSVGKAALITLDKVAGVQNQQRQTTLSLGVRRGQGLAVKSTLAWIVQLGS